MTKLPRIASRECIKALLKIGFQVDRQKGSHIILYRDNPYAKVIVPEMNLGQLAMLLRAEFLKDVIGYNVVRGLPFTTSEIVEATLEVLNA